jgi:hypothetical protein
MPEPMTLTELFMELAMLLAAGALLWRETRNG